MGVMHVQVYWALMVTGIIVSSYVYVYTFVGMGYRVAARRTVSKTTPPPFQ
jgi:hypothetical protein